MGWAGGGAHEGAVGSVLWGGQGWGPSDGIQDGAVWEGQRTSEGGLGCSRPRSTFQAPQSTPLTQVPHAR